MNCLRFANSMNNTTIINAFNSDNRYIASINPIQDGGITKKNLPVFFLQLLQRLELASKTFFLLDSFLLPHFCKFSRPYPVPVPNCWTWTKSISWNNCLFWSNPYKIEVMITSLKEMLELPYFGHITTTTTKNPKSPSWNGLRHNIVKSWQALKREFWNWNPWLKNH